ncbi:metallo-dependent hydrolase incomplete domain containing protein [Pandoravirus celtis]|uniref:Metallo-dependent hydrolase incomplete domain containing protein n=1 Tax=Pandoravirus celtis TaxID=2568002 RepID=A0A4D6EGM3_9VIRU|nr:metallo-dependent hydrolase incomplete domain containing protein [Pandoravirus celtis]
MRRRQHAVRRRRRPKASTRRGHDDLDHKMCVDDPVAPGIGLDSLPVEMVDAIVSKLDDPCDVARCRMASRLFWTRQNRPQDRYPDSACPCSRHLRMPMPRSRYDDQAPYPGHGFHCYPRAISDALARGLVDEADWLWRRYLSALCAPQPLDQAQRRVFPYVHGIDYTIGHAWDTATKRGNVDAIRWAYKALVSVGLCPEPPDGHEAALAGRADVVRCLLDANLLGDTWGAATAAAKGGHLDLVRMLLDAPRRVKDARHQTSVWSSAAVGGHLTVATALLDEFGLGYKRNVTPERCRPFDVETAASTGAIDALVLLWQRHDGAKYARDAVAAAAKACRVDVIEWLISMGVQPDTAEMASACACRGHGPRAPHFDRWRRLCYGFSVSCDAIRCAIDHHDADALGHVGAKEIRLHIKGQCQCRSEIDWRRLLGDLFCETNNPNAPTAQNRDAMAAMTRHDSDVARMALVMAQAHPHMCVAAGWLAIAVRTGNKPVVDALLPHADACAARDAAYEACKTGDQQLFTHLAALCGGPHGLHISLADTHCADMAAFLIDTGAVDTPSVYTLADAVRRGHARIVEAILAHMPVDAGLLSSTHGDSLLHQPHHMLLHGAAEAGSAEIIAILTASAFGPLFDDAAYHVAMETAAKSGRLDLVVQLVDAMRIFGRQPDPQVVSQASVCARLVQQDDHVATASPLSTDEAAVMRSLVDGKTIRMADGYRMGLDTCTRIARVIRRWPRLATPDLITRLIHAGVHAAWLEQLYATHRDLFVDDMIDTLIDAAIMQGAADIVDWFCQRCVMEPSFAAQAALIAVGLCDVAVAQRLLVDGGGAVACNHADLVAAAASAVYDPLTENSCDRDKWRAYRAEQHTPDEKAAADRMDHVDGGRHKYQHAPLRETKARAWVSAWAKTRWRPAAVGIAPAGPCDPPLPAASL